MALHRSGGQSRRRRAGGGLRRAPRLAGWVDFHGHADWTCLDHLAALNLLLQGCTLTVAGNCTAPGPVTGPATALLARGEGKGYHAATIDALAERYPRLAWSLGDFLGAERARPGVNYVQLAGTTVSGRP